VALVPWRNFFYMLTRVKYYFFEDLMIFKK
jgi:hypothetical protein